MGYDELLPIFLRYLRNKKGVKVDRIQSSGVSILSMDWFVGKLWNIPESMVVTSQLVRVSG
jgi:hypothetical protein